MGTIVNVIKADGRIEPFSGEKVVSSLVRAGADMDLAQRIVEMIKPRLYQNIPSFQIYAGVMDILKKEQKELAQKYNLKSAIMDLGPTGYPFEKFMAAVLNENGYKTMINQMVKGKCVTHEVDIVAENDKTYLVECKFHNQPGYRTDIKVALYTYARFLDVRENGFDYPWLITNTKLTEEAKIYAGCVGMKLTSWDFPEEESLRKLIDISGLYPVTTLVDVPIKEKIGLVEKGIVFCRDLKNCSI